EPALVLRFERWIDGRTAGLRRRFERLRIPIRFAPALPDDIQRDAVEIKVRMRRLRLDPVLNFSGDAVDGLVRVLIAGDASFPLEETCQLLPDLFILLGGAALVGIEKLEQPAQRLLREIPFFFSRTRARHRNELSPL